MVADMLLKMLLTIICVGVISAPIQAQTLAKTAGEFAKLCADVDARAATRNPELTLNHGYCLGYMQGVLITNYLFDRLKRGDAFYCPAIEVTPDQARKVFIKYVNDHPERLHEELNFVVMESLVAAFPCKSPATR